MATHRLIGYSVNINQVNAQTAVQLIIVIYVFMTPLYKKGKTKTIVPTFVAGLCFEINTYL